MRAFATARRGLAVAVLVIAVLAPAAAARSRTEASIVRAMNDIRARHHLPGLHVNGALARAASAHSSEMARSGLLSHGAFEARLRGYVSSHEVGENLAWLRGCSGRRVVSMWLHSAPHRKIMLGPRFRKVGVGRRSASGSCFVTADFASAR
jgi:uncharacterized protein YkwD